MERVLASATVWSPTSTVVFDQWSILKYLVLILKRCWMLVKQSQKLTRVEVQGWVNSELVEVVPVLIEQCGYYGFV